MAIPRFEVKEPAFGDVSTGSRNDKRNVVECSVARLGFVIIGFCVITTAVALMVYYVPDRSDIKGTKSPIDGPKRTTITYNTESRPLQTTLPDSTPALPARTTVRQTTADLPTDDPLMVGRLPRTVLPRRYLLNVRPYLYEDDAPYSALNSSYTFDGWVRIKVECVVPTDEIVLHSYALTVRGAVNVTGSDSGDSRQLLDRFTFDDDNMFLVLKLKETLQPRKNYEISIEFTGLLDKEKTVGFYVSDYSTNEGAKRLTATTQMEGPHARRVLPCFDEPSFKASFDVQIEHRSDMTALSNGMETSTIRLDDHWSRTYFKRVGAMPTYLLAMVVHDFQNVSGTTEDGCLVRMWIQPEYILNVSTALDYAIRMQTFFNSFLGMKYPLEKLDHIGIRKMYGAMENWGLVTYDEDMLIDEADELTITHEVSHQLDEFGFSFLAPVAQWFGNLVTPEWWDDLWLNEGFANYHQHVGMDFLDGGQQNYEYFYRKTMAGALEMDIKYMVIPALKDPVSSDVDDIDRQIVTFTYIKGGSITFMVKHFLADGVFENGIRNYLKERAYKNANVYDLWEELTYADQDVGKHDIKKIMDTWTLQRGAPLVTLNRTGSTIVATQERWYIGFPSHPDPFSERYYIPLTYVHKSDPNNPTTIFMEPDDVETIVNLEGASGDDWYLANFLQTGYYFVTYDLQNWQRIVDQAQKNPNVFSIQNQLGLIHQVMLLGRAGLVPANISDSLIDALSKSSQGTMSKSSQGTMEIALEGDMLDLSLLRGQRLRKVIKRRVVDNINRLYSGIGWRTATTRDPSALRRMGEKPRLDITSLACFYGNSDCVNQATTLFIELMDNPPINSVQPAFRYLVYCNGIRYGGQVEWDFAWSKMGDTSVDREKAWWAVALTCSVNTTALTRYIDTLDGSSSDQNLSKVIQALAENPIGTDMAWTFVHKNWDRLSSESFDVHWACELLRSVTAIFSTTEKLEELLDFGNGRDFGRAQYAYDTAVMQVNFNIEWVAKYLANQTKIVS